MTVPADDQAVKEIICRQLVEVSGDEAQILQPKERMPRLPSRVQGSGVVRVTIPGSP